MKTAKNVIKKANLKISSNIKADIFAKVKFSVGFMMLTLLSLIITGCC